MSTTESHSLCMDGAITASLIRSNSVVKLVLGATLLSFSSFFHPASAALTIQPDQIADQVESSRKDQESLSPPPWTLGPTQTPASGWQIVIDERRMGPEFEAVPVPQKSANRNGKS